MYAIVTAGGIPNPGEPLYEYTQGLSKAMLPIAGKPMIQWVLDALSEARSIQSILIMGLTPESGITSSKPMTFTQNRGGMLENILEGVKQVQTLDPTVKHALLVSSDIPAITPEMVDWVVNEAMKTDDDFYYNVIDRQTMENRYPNSKRTYTRLKNAEVCGGDMNVARTMTISGKEDLFNQIIDSRKNPAKQAAILGFDVLFLLLTRQLTLQDAEQRISRSLGLKGRVVLCPYAEVGMDVDKPYQLELVRADLERQAGHAG